MKIIDEIMKRPPLLTDDERREVARLAVAMGRGECCVIEFTEGSSTVLAAVLLAGLEALDAG